MTREEAIENLKWLLECSYVDSFEDAENEALEMAIKALEQEPKTGHWIPSHIPESILDECSECGFSCGAFTFNYCPNCGARMESEE